jgi:hypothetical protein
MPSQSPRHVLLARPIPQHFIKQKGGPIEKLSKRTGQSLNWNHRGA